MTHLPQHLACWFEIPVTDLEASRAFYSGVLDQTLSIETMGPNPTVVLQTKDNAGVAGHLYPGTPSRNGPTIHLVAPKGLDAARARIEVAGGTVESPDITIPAGTFFYARDPDGNSIGIFNRAG